MEVNVLIGRKESLFAISIIFVLLITGIGVAYSTDNPLTFGHSSGEIEFQSRCLFNTSKNSGVGDNETILEINGENICDFPYGCRVLLYGGRDRSNGRIDDMTGRNMILVLNNGEYFRTWGDGYSVFVDTGAGILHQTPFTNECNLRVDTGQNKLILGTDHTFTSNPDPYCSVSICGRGP